MLQIVAILFPIIAGAAASLGRMSDGARNKIYAAIMLITDALGIAAIIRGGDITLMTLSDKVNIAFALDDVGRVFLAAVLMLYTAVCFYAFEYMKHEERPNVFFAFYFISLGAMMSVCMARNLVTVYLCFELATLTSVPLVLHEMTRDAVAAGLKYLFYSIAGALLGLLAVFFVYYYSGSAAEFTYGGFIDRELLAGHENLLLAMAFVGIIGFGTKAGMYPMHGWLPTAHPIAPAPASALLSGIIAKAGVLAIIRLVYYSIGADLLRGTWVQYAWTVIAMLTIFMGSMMAFREKVLKKRLAYSTISQISYILLSLSVLTQNGIDGALLHVMGHAAAKGCLFMVAGAFIYKFGWRSVDQLRGVGRRMPVTMWCFTIAALSLVGIPPLAGFVSKWVIASAAIADNSGVFALLPPIILLISALLTAGYLLPVVVDAFFPGADFKGDADRAEPSKLMTVPMLILCAVTLIVGVFGQSIVSAIVM